MIGILGGTFDPVHDGHVEPALDLAKRLRLAQIRFVLARNPPHRDPPAASAAHRWRMLNLALEALPGLVADDRELRRAGPSYTVDTLRGLRAEVGARQSLCLIMGNDAFAHLTSWNRWQELPALAHIVITARPDTPLPAQGEVAELLERRRAVDADALARQPAGGILPCAVRQFDISATRIRARIAQGKDDGADLAPSVWQYIRRHKLYAAPTETLNEVNRQQVNDGD